ncbi:hypothetical protein [Collimonas sp. OK307]|uniref:hypothetical protein n=1 Tax=Collimonas sp. OK307 TaxID=1801620 RepID=UPI001587DA31|nr:hypothetical protein [Collimonas sp. OK307]
MRVAKSKEKRKKYGCMFEFIDSSMEALNSMLPGLAAVYRVLNDYLRWQKN